MNIEPPDIHEQALEAAHARALSALRNKATHENIRVAEAAEKALSDYRNRQADGAERRFANLLEAHAYLQGEGWKVSKSKLYEDQGQITRQKDGMILASSLDRYARAALNRLDGTDADESALAARKTRSEIALLEERRKKEERLNDTISRKLVLRSEVEQRFANRLAFFKVTIEDIVYGAAMENAIEAAGGDMNRLPEAQEILIKRFRAALEAYSKSLHFSIPRKALLEAMEEVKESD